MQLLLQYGDKKVGCKLSPIGDFEGVDSLLNWGMAGTQKVSYCQGDYAFALL
jgi:hypothetical protein